MTTSDTDILTLQELFKVLDVDDSGYVDRDELTDWITHEANMSIDANELFVTIDKNNNGEISAEELAEYYKSFSAEQLHKVTESLYDRHAARLAHIRSTEMKDDFDFEVPYDDDASVHKDAPETSRDDEVTRVEQRTAVEEVMKKHAKEVAGETWYAVSEKWWRTWKEYVSQESLGDAVLRHDLSASSDTNIVSTDTDGGGGGGSVDDMRKPRMSRSLSFQYGQHPGPMDNGGIAGEQPGELRLGLAERFDFVLVPEEVWTLLRHWYGGGPAFPRQVNALPKGGTQVDLWPCFLVLVWCDSLTGKPNARTVVRRVVSRSAKVAEMMSEYGDADSTRLWVKRLAAGDDDGDDGTSSNGGTGGGGGGGFVWSLFDKSQWYLELMEAQIVSGDTLLLEAKNDLGQWPRGDVTKPTFSPATTDTAAATTTTTTTGSGGESTAEAKHDFRDFQIGDEVDVCDSVGKWYRSVIRDVKETKVFVHFEGWTSKWDEWLPTDSERIAPADTHTTGRYVSKSQVASQNYARDLSEKGTPVAPGAVGLRNLGNTCFMNSTLQCILNAPALRDYFLGGVHTNEVNRDNPLGHMGRVADEFANLMTMVYSHAYRVVAPASFKHTIGEFAPQFSGFQQHDSSELLSFLLDGLHEDLNRVVKKPYTQEVESNGRPDAVVAAEALDVYRLRNDSIIVDTMTGQLKSTIVCPVAECGRVSVKFDPFLFLSVPLPIETTRVVPLTLVPFDAGTTPMVFGVRVSKQGNVGDLVAALAELATDVDVDTLRVAEIFHHKVYRELPRTTRVGQIRASDTIYVFEVRVPAPAPEDVEVAKQQFAEMAVGQIVDALDTDRNWYEADIVDMDDSRVKVHYAGWSKKWNEWHEKDSERLAPRHTYSRVTCWEVSCYNTTRARDNFGVPFFMCIQQNSMTNRQLHARIRQRCVAMMVEGKEEAEAEAEATERADPQFIIRVRSANGGMCGKCKKYSCLGCPLDGDSDDFVQFNNKTGAMLAIEWPSSSLFDREKGETVLRHASAPVPDVNRGGGGGGGRGGAGGKLLSDCLRAYTKAETLGKDDAWFCSSCKEFREANKKFDVFSVPDILVIHLKRFSYTKIWREKLETFIDFPLDGLDMAPYMKRDGGGGGDDGDDDDDAGGAGGGAGGDGAGGAGGDGGGDGAVLYDLFGVSNHMGGLQGGHYIASVRKDNKWYNMDDSRVSELKAEEVVSKNAYMLFYQRRK